ncbi:MAG: hypothetical protein K2X29_11905, partial [Candidatus Obscuribacterales bacterium]|nr:hypothetical protein [Candidatus Obscuribacterales bacterium]
MDKSDQADSQGKGVKKLNRFRILLLSLAVMWWGYISYLCLSIWPGYLPVLMTFGLVILSVVIAVCWKLLLPVGDNKFVVRNSICIIVFMLITGFACNQFVHREEQARQRRSTTPEIRQLAETVTYHLLDQSYIN